MSDKQNPLKRLYEQIRALWKKGSLAQKITLISIVAVLCVGMVFILIFSSSSPQIPLLTQSITDEEQLNRITIRLDQEGVEYTVTADNRIIMNDRRTAQRIRSILTREDLLPTGTDPWELFDIQRWTLTDFERSVNLQRSITRQLEQHIMALDDIDSASVTIVFPDEELFAEEQNPVTASVIIIPKPSSDIRQNTKKIEGIQKLIQFAVEGLLTENITITDTSGIVLNDFDTVDNFDRLELARKELEIVREEEDRYRDAIVKALTEIYSVDRVQVININVEMDMGKRTEETEEFFPIETVKDNPQTPFNESEFVLSIPRSTENINENYEGTGINPEGPPGVEGQTPPAYRDLEGLVGRWNNTEERINNEVNRRRIVEEKSPFIKRITASVALDGVWHYVYNEEGDIEIGADGTIVRRYVPVSDEELSVARELVEHAIGANAQRADSVSIRHIQFDRSEEFYQEDERYKRREQVRITIFYSLLGVAAFLAVFIVFRLIYKEVERRRRLREEELARQHQAVREEALRKAEEDSAAVDISVEERVRLELEESAVSIAREAPENVARLMRTWLMEE